jgi:hypothetical protein
MTDRDAFVQRLDALLTQAERFRDTGAVGEAASRARHVISVSDLELVRRPPDERAAIATRRLLALRLIEELRAPPRRREDLGWLERAIARLDVAIHAVLADGQITADEERVIAALDLGPARDLVSARERLLQLRRVVEGVRGHAALETRVRELARTLSPADRRLAMETVVVLARYGARLTRVESYRDGIRTSYDRDLVQLFARALSIDAQTLSELEAR